MVGKYVLFCGMYIDEITELMDFNKLEKYSFLKKNPSSSIYNRNIFLYLCSTCS